MLGWVLTVLGAVIVVGTVIDALWTVLWLGSGAGPLTSAVARAAQSLVHRAARHRRSLLAASGPMALLSVATVWAMLLWTGFALLFQGEPEAVVSASTGRPAAAIERAYFAGYTLFTLGIGDFVPGEDGWRVATVITSATGLFTVTLTVTYVLPVISAAVGQRSFASSVLALGQTPAEVVAAGWDGERVALDGELRQWSGQLSNLAYQHLAYPVLHAFHSANPAASAPRAVAILHDAALLLDTAVAPAAGPAPAARRQLRAAIDSYLSTWSTSPLQPAEEEPPPPSLSPLREAGVRLTGDEDDVRAAINEAAATDERRTLRRLVEAAGLEPPTT